MFLFLFAVRNSIYSWHFIKDNILVIPFNLSQDKWITNKQSLIGLVLFPSFFACNILAGTSSLFALSFRISHYHSVLTLLTSHFLILWRSQILFFRASVFISFLCPTMRQKAYIQQHSTDTPHPWSSSQFWLSRIPPVSEASTWLDSPPGEAEEGNGRALMWQTWLPRDLMETVLKRNLEVCPVQISGS